jgi:hypothetical protein
LVALKYVYQLKTKGESQMATKKKAPKKAAKKPVKKPSRKKQPSPTGTVGNDRG